MSFRTFQLLGESEGKFDLMQKIKAFWKDWKSFIHS